MDCSLFDEQKAFAHYLPAEAIFDGWGGSRGVSGPECTCSYVRTRTHPGDRARREKRPAAPLHVAYLPLFVVARLQLRDETGRPQDHGADLPVEDHQGIAEIELVHGPRRRHVE